jgi:hypothetical protein
MDGDETHDAYIYQYNMATKQLKVVVESTVVPLQMLLNIM